MQKIHTNFILKFVHEIREKFVHEFMPEDYVFKEKIWGKVSDSPGAKSEKSLSF